MAFFSGGVQRLLRHSQLVNSHLTSIRLISTLTSPSLFITCLSKETTSEKLKQAFSPFGQLLKAKVITDRSTKRSKGYGFVTYATIEEAEKAREGMNAKILDGWVIFVNPGQEREPRPPKQSQSQPSKTESTDN